MRDLEPRDGRKPGWFWADNKVLEVHAAKIGLHAFAVYMALSKHTNENGQCWPSTKTIAKLLGISQRTVVKAIHTLDDYGLIILEERSEKGKGQISHMYTLTPGDMLSPRATRKANTPMHDMHRGYAPDAQAPMHDMHTNKTKVNKTQLTNDDAPSSQMSDVTTDDTTTDKRRSQKATIISNADPRDAAMKALGIHSDQRRSILKNQPDLTLAQIEVGKVFVSSPPTWCNKSPLGHVIKCLRNGDPIELPQPVKPPSTQMHPAMLAELERNKRRYEASNDF